MTLNDVWGILPARDPTSHKGTFGRVLLVCGSTRYRGAAALCTEGALRCGAGLVTLASTEPVLSLTLARTPECTLLPCTADGDGGIGTENLPALLETLSACQALVLGPGLGKAAAPLVRALLPAARCPVVLDADGLNAVAEEGIPLVTGGGP
ncbi:MAG: NAD(P)H-hydrate dehydratase, partial [Oscillospiraceae bacterium]|nr:NAD(P)H-hydrate dehydratase [Oscillospiraceae bacterium]